MLLSMSVHIVELGDKSIVQYLISDEYYPRMALLGFKIFKVS